MAAMEEKAPPSAILRVDDNDPLTSTPCQSLRISYKDPKFSDVLTEEVFLDPRDSLLGENGLLLVNAAGVTALQQKSDREHRWAQSALATVATCRRDYLREQQYLLDELRRLSQLAQARCAPPMVEKDIAELMDGAMKSAELATEDPSLLANPDEIAYLEETVGGARSADGVDNELLDQMSRSGLEREDELTRRIMLQKMRSDTAKLFNKRANLREAVEAVEGTANTEKGEEESFKVLVEEMLKQAQEEESGRKDIIETLLNRAETPEQHKAIEDAVTKNLYMKYDTMLTKYQELEPKAERWRDMLALNEEKAAIHFYLTKEVERMEEEAQKRQSESRRKEEEREEQAAKKEAERKAKGAMEPDEVEDLTNQIMEKLDGDAQARIKEEQHQVNVNKRRADKLREEVLAIMEKVKQFEARRDAISRRIESAEEETEASNEAISESEECVAKASELFRRMSRQEVEAKRRREVLEDEVNAARRPPPKEKDTRKLESEVEAARAKNEELREHEAQLYEREREYEARFEQTELAWKAYEEEEAAAKLAAEMQHAERAQEEYEARLDANPHLRVEDPTLLAYKDRFFLPEYSEVARYNLLHLDNRARDRRLSKTRRGVAEDQAEQLLARMRSTESEVAASSGPKSQVPVNFRRPEDIKMRFKIAERNVGTMAGDLAERGAVGARLAEDLHHLGMRLGSAAAESSRIHAAIPQKFSSFLHDGLPSSVLREQLVHALQDHQVCMSRAEDAWRHAESGCTRGSPEMELELEQEACARCEDDLISAARGLYSTARQAIHDGPSDMVPHAERCCKDFDDAEPELTEAATTRGEVWPEILSVATELAEERELQAHIGKHLQAEERRKKLLDAERSAPPEARRALAAMRAATSTTSRLTSSLLE